MQMLKRIAVVIVNPHSSAGPSPLCGVPLWKEFHKHFFITSKAFKISYPLSYVLRKIQRNFPVVISGKKKAILLVYSPFFSQVT